jgi:peptidoglycan hydrolase-like protein with peptidoglycan-binding domain
VARAVPGDLVFWGRDPRNPGTVFHVAVYLGGGMVLAAPRTGTVVQVQPLKRPHLMPLAVRPAGLKASAVLPVRPGSRGADVKVVQRRLRANGYDLPVTGYYGPLTTRAVRDVQRRARLRGSQVGPATWAYLLTHGARDKNP